MWSTSLAWLGNLFLHLVHQYLVSGHIVNTLRTKYFHQTHPCFFSHSSAWIFFSVSGSMSSVCFFFFDCLLLWQSLQLHRGLRVQSDPGGDGLPW